MADLLPTRQTLTAHVDMPRGRKIKTLVVEALPSPQEAPVCTPEDESPTPPIEAVLRQGIESDAAAAALQKHIAIFIADTVTPNNLDDSYLNDGGALDTMPDYWNPEPSTAEQVCASQATFVEGELHSIGAILGAGQPNADGWYSTQFQSDPPAAAGGASAAAAAHTLSTPLRPSSPVSPSLISPNTLPQLSSDKGVSSVKRRSPPNPTDEKKKKRQKKVKVTDPNDMSAYTCVPLTAASWPVKANVPLTTPERVFYPLNSPNSQIEVYAHPNYSGVAVVQYVGSPYEKRLNLNVATFKKLYELSGIVLEKWSEIKKDGDSGLTSTNNSYKVALDVVGFIQLLVTLYKGQPKIHIGTGSYINEIIAGAVGSQRQVKTHRHCGQTLNVHVMKDIADRVGRVLTDYPFCPEVVNLT